MNENDLYADAYYYAAVAQWTLDIDQLQGLFKDSAISCMDDLAEAFQKPVFIHKLRFSMQLVSANKQAIDLFEYADQEELGKHLAWHFPEHVLMDIAAFLLPHASTEQREIIFTDHHRSSVEDLWLCLSCFSVNSKLCLLCSAASSRSVLRALKQTKYSRAYQQERALSAKAFEIIADALYITDKAGEVIQVNQAFCDISGYARTEVLGIKPSEFKSGWHAGYFAEHIEPQLQEAGVWFGEIMARRKNGEAFVAAMHIAEVRDSNGVLTNHITAFHEVAEQAATDQKVKQLAYYDPLTNLPNRTLFSDRLFQALQRGVRERYFAALLFLDLDGFKPVNDRFGHALGDQLLTQVAARLVDCVRGDDTVARMGGDEFAIILHSLKSRDIAESSSATNCKKILHALDEPFLLEGQRLSIGASIGIALYPDDAIEQDSLLRCADVAIYHAKKFGKNQYQFYTDDMHRRDNKRQELAQDIERAISSRELSMVYQPRFDANSLSLIGFEALLRWQHADGRVLKPSMFLRSIEELGLGEQVGEMVLSLVFDKLQKLCASGFIGQISVNIFQQHFRAGKIAPSIASLLKQYDVAPHQIMLEFKEAMIMEDTGFAFSSLQSLRQLGVQLALDDFATGEVGLKSLRRLPFDEMKIDKQFMMKLDQSEDQLNFVKTLIDLINGFKSRVCIEGVERETQLDLLQSCNIYCLQGYLLGEPMPEQELEAFIARQVHFKGLLN